MSEEYTFTDLSERLRGPDGEAVAERVRTRLGELQQIVAGRIAAGVASGEYDRYRVLADALAAAQRIMVLMAKPAAKDVRGGGDLS